MSKIDNTEAIELLETFSKREILQICDTVGFKYNDGDKWLDTHEKFITALEKWEYDINFIL